MRNATWEYKSLHAKEYLCMKSGRQDRVEIYPRNAKYAQPELGMTVYTHKVRYAERVIMHQCMMIAMQKEGCAPKYVFMDAQVLVCTKLYMHNTVYAQKSTCVARLMNKRYICGIRCTQQE